jgi:formate-dependent phosphoribosylglycinamide formyltransferase (GAR transformylase)
MRNVVFIAPFPLETTLRFARAVSALPNVRMVGVMQEPPRGDDAARFYDIVRVGDGLDTTQLIEAVTLLRRRHGEIFRILGILEPLQVQLAEVRKHFGVPGPDVETADRFRDKARMKDVLRAHGLPCARHKTITSVADAEAFVKEVGFPIVLKPPAGMGCKATWRIRSDEELRGALDAVRVSPDRPTLAEEFLRGRELSFETITIGGEVRFQSVSHYFPGPLEVTENPWIQWCCMLPRDMSGPEYEGGREMGVRAVKVLGLETGFTHMEWFRRDDGSLAIGEIAARPPGANIVRMNGFAHDTDMYKAWARAVVDDAFDGPWNRRWAVGCAFLRGQGRGRVVRVTGVQRANELVGKHVVEANLPTVGAPKSDSYEGDGYVIVRDGDTEVVKRALKTVIETIRVDYA